MLCFCDIHRAALGGGDGRKGVGAMSALTESDSSIDPEEIHDILRNDRRRHVLEYLTRRLEPVSLRDLAERIAVWETGKSPPPTNIRQSVYNSLHQTHLPKLDATGIVEYDKNRKRVKLCEQAREIDPYMNVVTRFGISWRAYYRTLGVLGLCAIVAAETGVPVFTAIGPLALATGLLVVFAVSTAYQLWSRRWLYVRVLHTPK